MTEVLSATSTIMIGVLKVGQPTRLTAGRQCSVLPVQFTEVVNDRDLILQQAKFKPATFEDLEYWLVQNHGFPLECTAICVPLDDGSYAQFLLCATGWKRIDDAEDDVGVCVGDTWLLCRRT